jgi:hypothetical protein
MTDTLLGLSADELADMRAEVLLLLPDLCEVQQLVQTINDVGESAKSYTTKTASVACRLDPERSFVPTGTEMMGWFGGYIFHTGRFVMTMAYNADITLTDIVVLAGVRYEVAHVDANKSWAVSSRVLVKALDI